MTFNSGDNSGCADYGGAAFGLACDGDGIGIIDDEITAELNQLLTVSFTPTADVINIYLLDLFDNSREFEVAMISVTGDGTVYTVDGTGIDLGGFIITGITQDDVTTITFEALDNGDSDYALAAIEVSSIPEPGTLGLLGAGLLALGLMRRKRVSSSEQQPTGKEEIYPAVRSFSRRVEEPARNGIRSDTFTAVPGSANDFPRDIRDDVVFQRASRS